MERKRVVGEAEVSPSSPVESGEVPQKGCIVAEAEASPSQVVGSGEPPKKVRKKSVTAKSLGLTKAEWGRVKPLSIKKMLKQFSKTLAKQVDANWHDGWEAQGETVLDWAAAVREPLQAVLDIGVARRLALEQCNDVLRIVGDSWRDLDATPCRVPLNEMMGDQVALMLELPWGGEKTFTGFYHTKPLEDMVGFVWRMLLRGAASGARIGTVEAQVVYRGIKDASDNGVTLVSCELGEGADRADGEGEVAVGAGLEAGPLDGMVRERENWVHLESGIRTFRKRRCIDRRFFGTPERRTRAYDGQEQEDVEGQNCSMQ